MFERQMIDIFCYRLYDYWFAYITSWQMCKKFKKATLSNELLNFKILLSLQAVEI